MTMEWNEQDWLDAIQQAPDLSALKEVDGKLFGKKGLVQDLVKSVSTLPKEERPQKGKEYNLLKQRLQKTLDERREVLDREAMQRDLAAPDFDPTVAYMRGKLKAQDADGCGRQIVNALVKGKRRVVLTSDGRTLTRLSRHFPNITDWALSRWYRKLEPAAD